MNQASKRCLNLFPFTFLLIPVLLTSSFQSTPIFAQESSKNKTLQFSKVISSANQSVALLLLREIYQRAGITIQATNMSSKRSLTETSRGHMDGELLRIKAVETQYPSLIRIPISVYQIKTQLFKAKKHPHVIDSQLWHSHKFAIVSGILHSEEIIEKHAITKVQRLVDLKQMLNFVSLGRADIGITSRLNGLRYINHNRDSQLTIFDKPIKTQPLYHYLHNKHIKIVPVIDAIIRKMRDSGELQALTEKYERQVLLEPY